MLFHHKWATLFFLVFPLMVHHSSHADVSNASSRDLSHFRHLFDSHPQSQYNAEVDALIERESRITELLKIVNTQNIETSNPNALASAIYLLGQYRAVEAICPLLKHLTFRPANSERWITHTVAEPETYPAVTALITIGSTPFSKGYLTYRVMDSKDLLQRNLTAYVLSQLIGKEAFTEFVKHNATSANPSDALQQTLEYINHVPQYIPRKNAGDTDKAQVQQKYFLGLFSASNKTRRQTIDEARKQMEQQQQQERTARIVELIAILHRSHVDTSFGGPVFSAMQLLSEYKATAAIPAICDWLTYRPEIPPRTFLRLTTEQEKYPAVRALIRINDTKSTFPILNKIIATSSEPLPRELAAFVLARILGREETILKLESASKTASMESKSNYQQAIKFVKTVHLRPQLPKLTLVPPGKIPQNDHRLPPRQNEINLTWKQNKRNFSETDLFSKIRVTLSTQREQKISNGGIHLTVQIHNDAEYDNYISNPFDRLLVRLTTQDIRNEIPLPIATPRILVHRAKDINKIDVPFTIHHVILNGKELTSKEIEAYHFKILPKSTFTFEIEFDKKQKYTQADLGYIGEFLTEEQIKKVRETVALPADRYRLSLSLGLSAPRTLPEKRGERRSISFEHVDLWINLVP